MLQDMVLDPGSILGADPVLGGGAHKALGRVLVLHPTGVPSQPAVDVAEGDQHIAVVALQMGRTRMQGLVMLFRLVLDLCLLWYQCYFGFGLNFDILSRVSWPLAVHDVLKGCKCCLLPCATRHVMHACRHGKVLAVCILCP